VSSSPAFSTAYPDCPFDASPLVIGYIRGRPGIYQAGDLQSSGQQAREVKDRKKMKKYLPLPLKAAVTGQHTPKARYHRQRK